ncbi:MULTISPECIES: hypothetical protein [Streptomyces]|uniref:Regulatory protein n=1 Tax=Streptomyces toxytricini TaxID=67369 RepID=A0ABW8EBC2_STRT5|nr:MULTISPECIES: hypothetical protein [Streptomyces]MBD3576141.1 hypothetical protein [Streptomyces sp. KD18]GGS97361.1 hypothetical protein GCM10010286_22910 [Streptomyces toxytricini]
MRQLPIDTAAAMVMVAQPPTPKIKDRRTGEIATDPETNATLMTVDVLFAAYGEAEVLSVVVPKPGITGDLTMGTPVALTGLVARPWENEFNGQKRHGISFKAIAVTSLAADASKAKGA